MKIKITIICILVIYLLVGILMERAYCEEFYGWVKKENVDAPCDYFPTPVGIMEDGNIYSEPNTAEIYRIGYAEYNDRVTTLSKTIIDDEKWINIQFPEWLLLKNKNMKSKMIVGSNKFLAQTVGMILGGLIGFYIMENTFPPSPPSVNNNMIGLLYPLIGVTVGFLGGSVLPEIYNRKVIDDYGKNENH